MTTPANQYGNPYSKQTPYYYGQSQNKVFVGPRQDEYRPDAYGPGGFPKVNAFTDPNVYYDPDSYADMIEKGDDIDYQKTMPNVPTLDEYEQQGMYNHKKPQQHYLRGRDGGTYKITDPEAPLQDFEDPNPFNLRYGPTVTNQTPEDVGGETSSPLFNISPKHGPVHQLFFSRENIRRLGDYFDSRGLGRPSASNLREYMQLIYADNPDFIYDPRRDEASVRMQLQRLNALLIGDMLPILESAKESFIRYQYDSYFGYGWTMPDRGIDVSSKRRNTALEMDNHLF